MLVILVCYSLENPAHNRIVVGSRPAGSTIFFPKRRTEIFLSAFFLCVEGVSVVRRRRGRGEAEGLRERGAARMRDGRCRRACEGHRRGEAKRGRSAFASERTRQASRHKGHATMRRSRGRKGERKDAADRARKEKPAAADDGKSCARRKEPSFSGPAGRFSRIFPEA